MSLFSFRFPALLRRVSRETLIFLAIALLGLVAIAGGSVLVYQTHFQHPKFSYLPTDQVWKDHLHTLVERARQNLESTPQATDEITVEVAGAVTHPGVYRLSKGARVQDALLMAGGFLLSAQKQYIHQELNLAHLLVDQQKIYIPTTSEPYVKSSPLSNGQQSPNTTRGFNANTLTLNELLEIDGIGQKRAEDYLAGQPYENIDDVRKRSKLPASIVDALEQGGLMF